MGLINIIAWIIFGIVAGTIARALMPGDDPGGLKDAKGVAITSLIGIVGSVIGGILGNLIDLDPDRTFSIGSLFMAVLGAIILLWIYRKIKEK